MKILLSSHTLYSGAATNRGTNTGAAAGAADAGAPVLGTLS